MLVATCDHGIWLCYSVLLRRANPRILNANYSGIAMTNYVTASPRKNETPKDYALRIEKNGEREIVIRKGQSCPMHVIVNCWIYARAFQI